MPSSAASRFFSYHKLTKDVDAYPLTPQEPPEPFYDPSPATATTAAATHTARLPFGTRWTRLRRTASSSSRGGGAGWWRPRRPRVRVAGLRRLLGRKARLLRAAVRKVVQRFKEGKAHFGDLFAGNYMFLQVNPTSAASASKASAYIQAQRSSAAVATAGLHGRVPPPLPTAAAARYYLPYRVAA